MKINVKWKKRTINDAYLPFWDDQRQTQIFYGGSSSGKSNYILGQRVIKDLLEGGRNFLIVRNVAGSHRESTFNEIKQGIDAGGFNSVFKIKESDMTITCCNGYQAIFKGLDNVEKVKSIKPRKGVLTDIVIEEATECGEEKVEQLRRRMRGKAKKTKRLTLLFNPIYKTHWIYKNYFAGKWDETKTYYHDERTVILKTTYKDNKFLSDDEIYLLEHTKSDYFREVYTYGNWGVLGDLIFTNWKTADLSQYRNSGVSYRNGLDFGFGADPAALWRGFARGNQLLVTDAQYWKGLTNYNLAQVVKPIIGREPVVCDSAEPKSIQELRDYGVTALASKKGKDTVVFGLQYLMGFEILVHLECQDMINELSIAQWKKDKNGDTISPARPEEGHDHCIAAMRYANEQYMLNSRVKSGKLGMGF